MAGLFDGAAKLFLVVDAHASIVPVFNPLKTVHKMFDGGEVFVVDLLHLIRAERTAALAWNVLLIGGENMLFSHGMREI